MCQVVTLKYRSRLEIHDAPYFLTGSVIPWET